MLQLEPEKGTKPDEATAPKPKTLLPYMKHLPVKRIVPLPNVTQSPIGFTLRYEVSEGTPLPPGLDSPDIARFELSGIEEVVAKHNQTGKMNVHFRCVTLSRNPSLKSLGWHV